jgi:2-polyprenyl-3-methyl-5-hydroxy-6-metoxy-1,4-benzoquinol methylase
MSLSRAIFPDGTPAALLGDPPFPCGSLDGLVGVEFDLPCDDPWLLEAGTPGHAYLRAAALAWRDEPEWMDFEDPESPAFVIKRAQRDLYLHHWKPWLRGTRRVLDVGAGIGRLTLPLLDKGRTVWAVDGDLDSLRHLVWRASGLSGNLEARWSSVRRLPDVADLDVILACEVLCYVPDVEDVVADLARRLRPGGALLVSMEARWGWAAAVDTPNASWEEALTGTGVLDVPGDRWVRTWTDAELAALLEGAGLEVASMIPVHYVLDGPLERIAPEVFDLEWLLETEERCRVHPVWGPLNRAWAAVGVRPGG